MARPAKSVKVKSRASAGDDAPIRQTVENKLRGENTTPDPPPGLTDQQREIFGFIVDGLVESEILGKMDVFVLESTAIAVDRLRSINNMIDTNPQLIINTALQNSRAKYQSDLWWGCHVLHCPTRTSLLLRYNLGAFYKAHLVTLVHSCIPW